MKVKEVHFEKLFSLEKYNNERIGFTAEIEEGESPDKVAGELHFKILAIEDCLSKYRHILSWIDYASGEVEQNAASVRNTTEHMRKLKVDIAELAAKAEKGEVDAKLKHACSGESYKQLQENLQGFEEKCEKWDKKLVALVKAKQELRERIKNGDFTIEGIDIPVMHRGQFF